MASMGDRSIAGATLFGLAAVLLWALLAPLAVLGGNMPPFYTNALAFGVATGVGLFMLKLRGKPWSAALAPRWQSWAFGVTGLFGFHALYFAALRLAPAIEASLIVYLWPLLIVLLQALLPGEHLTVRHLVGALAGLGGTVVLVSRGGMPSFTAADLDGYIVALAAAFTWATYSVMNRRVSGDQALDSVTGYCAATAVLSLIAHSLFEPAVHPTGFQIMAIIGLGLGPVGLAFFVWDIATKHGDLKTLGVLAYLAPLLSTVILVAMGVGVPDWRLIVGCIGVVGGAALASGDLWRRPRPGGR